MKKSLFLIVGFFSLLFSQVSCSGSLASTAEGLQPPANGAIRLATYNIRSYHGSDTQDWKTRMASLDSLLSKYDFDIFGSQEPYQGQIDSMMKLKGDIYNYYVVNTANSFAKASTHSNPIFYKKDRFTLLKSGVFWFSETPDVAASVSWKASQPRNCNWVELYDKINKRSFFVFNSHFDHLSTNARNHSAELLIKRVKSIAGKNLAICTGDFNTVQTTNAFKTLSQTGLLDDTHAIARKVVNDDYKTNHGYKVREPQEGVGRIDHILISRSFKGRINLWQCCIDNFDGKWASDHYPIFIDFEWK